MIPLSIVVAACTSFEVSNVFIVLLITMFLVSRGGFVGVSEEGGITDGVIDALQCE